ATLSRRRSGRRGAAAEHGRWVVLCGDAHRSPPDAPNRTFPLVLGTSASALDRARLRKTTRRLLRSGSMSALEPNVLRLPKPDDRWVPRPYPREEPLDALNQGGSAGH